MQQTQQDAAGIQGMMPVVRAAGVVVITCGGFMLGGMMGSLIGSDLPAGIGAIVGSLSVGFIALIVGCCVTGMWWELMPDMSQEALMSGLSKAVPNALAPLVADHAAFTLIVTIHRVQDVRVGDRMDFLPWVSPNLYVEIMCGNNPVKRTCISDKRDAQGNPLFEEQFRVNITPQDSMFNIYVKDQAWFGAKLVAFTTVDIREDILAPWNGTSFPSKKEMTLQGGEDCTLAYKDGNDATLVCSFGHTADLIAGPFHPASKADIHNPQSLQEPIWQSDYGSVSYLSQVQFNQKTRVDFAAIQKMQPQQRLAPVDIKAGANKPKGEYGIASIWEAAPQKNDDVFSVYANV